MYIYSYKCIHYTLLNQPVTEATPKIFEPLNQRSNRWLLYGTPSHHLESKPG